MERDGDLPFTTVFDRVRDSYGHFDIKCGSRIFDYINAFIPDMDFREDLPVGSIPLERLTDYL